MSDIANITVVGEPKPDYLAGAKITLGLLIRDVAMGEVADRKAIVARLMDIANYLSVVEIK